jgi:hypothetical protein
MVAAAVVVTLAYLYVLIRDRGWAAQVPAGSAVHAVRCGAAVWFVLAMTDSQRCSDIGGPVDVIVLSGIAGMGAVGIAILVYTVEALVFRHATADAGDRSAQRGRLGRPAE